MRGARLDQIPNPEKVGDWEDTVSGLEDARKGQPCSQAAEKSVDITSSVTSITSLPTETLAMIFIFRHNDKLARHRNWQVHRYQERVLRLVSRRWCAIVDTTPQLWSAVGFSFSSWVELQDPTTSVDRLSSGLEKSKSSPLDVIIEIQDSDGCLYSTWDKDEHDDINHSPDHPSVPLARHLLLLTPYIHRFKSLRIASSWYSALSQTLETFLVVSAPLLEYISISYHRPTSWDFKWDGKLSFLLGGAPSLREVRLENLSLVDFAPRPITATHLTLSMCREAGVLKDLASFGPVFAKLTSLVRLRLEGMVFENYHAGDPPISIPTLRHLDVRSSNYPGLDTSIGYFYLPALKKLLLHDAVDSVRFINSASDGAAPKYPNVQKLNLYQRAAKPWEKQFPLLTRDLAYNFPNLNTLTLFCGKRKCLVSQVKFLRDNADCFPLLETLDLRGGLKNSDLLLSMLRQRVESGHPIIICRFPFDRAGGVFEQVSYLEKKVPRDYELDPVRPALIYTPKLGQFSNVKP